MPSTIVLLHGFAGTGRSWEPVIDQLDGERYRALAPDLRGRDFASCVAEVLALVPGRFVLCGYSMGGRIALHAALAAPERVARLVLVATTAGIADQTRRAARRTADEALAARIEGGTIEEFADDWMAQPLFAGTPAEAARLWRADLLRGEPRDLAAALRGLGTGVMTPAWDRLAELAMPATVVVGERDAKFRALGESLAARMPAANLVVVAGAGHGVPREAPGELAAILSAT